MMPRLRASAPSLARAAPFALIIFAVTLYDHRYHEFWRDEACALLEARAVPWTGLLHAMRLEGIPPLYHALLKVLATFLPNPAALLAAGALGLATLLTGTYRLAESITGSKRAATAFTLALSLTYTYGYELGVMIRQYSLGLGLALLSIAHFRRALSDLDRRHVWTGTLAAGLSALTSAHSACVAGGVLLAFGLFCLADRRPLRAFWPIFLTLPCFALVVHLALPFAERTPEANHVVRYRDGIAPRLAAQLLVEGLVPYDWWHAESFLPARLLPLFSALRSLGFQGVLASIALAFAARTGALRPRWKLPAFEVLAVIAGIPPLAYVMLYHYWGSYRHQLFLGMPLLVMAGAWSLDRSPAAAWVPWARRAAIVTAIPWFLLQFTMLWVDLSCDRTFPFSDTRAAAAALPPDARVVGKDEWQSAAIVFWRPDVHYRSPAGMGRPYDYTRPDRDWHHVVPLAILVEEECRVAPDRVVLAGPTSTLRTHVGCATLLDYPRMTVGDHPFTWESFDLHTIDCACVAAGPTPLGKDDDVDDE